MAGLTDKQWRIVEKGLVKIDKLANRITKIETAILGNGVKGLKQTVYDIQKSVDKIKGIPPKFSWKQVLANFVMIAAFGGILYGDKALTTNFLDKKITDGENRITVQISEIKTNIKNVQNDLDYHVQKPIGKVK